MELTKRKGNSIVFLDDCQTLNKILDDGYFKHHRISQENNLFTCSEASELFDLTDSGLVLDYLVLDYVLPGTDSLLIAQLIKHKNNRCKVWLFTGMPEKYIIDQRKKYVDRYINKDEGIPFVLNELYGFSQGSGSPKQ